MCRRDTSVCFLRANAHGAGRRAGTFGHLFVLWAVAVSVCHAQVPDIWKRVAGTTVDAGLAGPTSGPVMAVWYGAGGRLLVETSSSRVFETADFAHWRLNTDAIAPPAVNSPNVTKLPEAGARVQAAAARLYAAAPSNVYASDDSGRTWMNLTGFNNRSIIGDGFTSLAIAPGNPQEIAAANRFGVWRSLDGGLSWHSLNDDLPNLMVRRLIDSRTVSLADGAVETARSGLWTPADATDTEAALRGPIRRHRSGGCRRHRLRRKSRWTASRFPRQWRQLDRSPARRVRKHLPNLGGRGPSRLRAGCRRRASLSHHQRRTLLGRSHWLFALSRHPRHRGRPFGGRCLCGD